MSRHGDVTERRKRNLRDTQLWDRDLNGYAICPWCAAMIYAERTDLHQEKCWAAQRERRADKLRKAAGERGA